MKKIMSAKRKRAKYSNRTLVYSLAETNAEEKKVAQAIKYHNQGVSLLTKKKNLKDAINPLTQAVNILEKLKTKYPDKYSFSLEPSL